jgi:parallel beta-helix repeat protein
VLERFESRRLLTTFLVTTTADAGTGSLRQAITDANATPGPDVIDFSIESATAPIIQLQAALPPIQQAMTIDGTTQPGSNGQPYVELDGSNAGASASGLQIAATGVVVRGLVINRFQGPGILVLPPPGVSGDPTSTPSGVLIQRNDIGTDVSGTEPLGNGGYGIDVLAGDTTVDNNIISANGFDGVRVAGSAATNDQITNNEIGLDASGTVALGNEGSGIDVRLGASGTVIDSNTIAANGGDGIHLLNTSGISIQQNTVGLQGLGNGGAGISIESSTGTQVGSSSIQYNLGPGIEAQGVGAGNTWLTNTICNNGGGVGIRLLDGANNGQQAPVIDSAVSFVASSTTVTGTVVGAPSSNLELQFFLNPATDPAEGCTYLETIFTTTGADGTGTFSVVLPVGVGSDLTATVTDPSNGSSEFMAFQVPPLFTVTNVNDSGTGSLRQAILNANAHPNLDNPSGQPDVIDFKIPGPGPYIIHTGSPLIVTDPVVIDGYTQAGSQPNTAAIGDNAVIPVVVDGSPATGLAQAATGTASDSGLIVESGGTTVRGLVVDNFRGAGIYLESAGNLIEGNFVGTDWTGTAPLGNALGGVVAGLPSSAITAAALTSNVIGGAVPAARNLISGNDGPGVYLFGAISNGLVEGNLIGTDRSGSAPLGNANIGVLISNSSANVVGGTVPGTGNVISGNRAATSPGPNPDPATTGAGGVVIFGSSATGNVVAGNLIGTTADGTGKLGNAYDGVGISGAPGNTVGGGGTAGNTISANGNVGVRIAGAGASGNRVLNNRIGTAVSGTRPLGNVLDGVFLNGAPNNMVGAPGLGNVISSNGRSGIDIAYAGARGNLIQGNVIGTGPGGVGSLGNAWFGVIFQDATGNTVGGTQPGTANTIRNNRLGGVQVFVRDNPLLPGATGGNTVVGNVTTPTGPRIATLRGRIAHPVHAAVKVSPVRALARRTVISPRTPRTSR